MARDAGKASKKRAARRKSKKRSNKGRPRRARFDIATLAAMLGRVHTVVVAPSGLTDPAGTQVLRRGLPALDPALLPELVLLQHAAIQHFHLRPTPACPSKRELIDFFMRVRLSNGSQLRRHMASALATCVRPLSAMAGGRPRKKPRPSTDEQTDPEARVGQR